jgi:hypothetical protein
MGIARALMLCATVLVVACSQDSNQPVAGKPSVDRKAAASAKKGPTAQEQTAAMVSAASPSKSNVPVSLKFELQQRPVAGSTLEVDLAVLPEIDADVASIKVTDAEGLGLAAADAAFDVTDIDAGEVYRHTVHLTPAGDGVLFLGVDVTLKHDQIDETRAFSIPIIVAPQTAAAPQKVVPPQAAAGQADKPDSTLAAKH